MTSGIDDLIASFTARQHGLIARWQALGVGITARQLKHRIERGQLIPVHPGVYRLRGTPFTQELRWLAAVLAGGDGALLSHQAASVLHGYDIKRIRPVVTTFHARHPEIADITWHRTRRHNDITVVNKIPVTTKARTMLDNAAVLPYEVFEPLLQNAVTSGRLQVEQMLAILDRRGGRGVPGITATRTALEGGLVDEKIEKQLELIIARIVDRARVPSPLRQHPVTGADGKHYVLDNFCSIVRRGKLRPPSPIPLACRSGVRRLRREKVKPTLGRDARRPRSFWVGSGTAERPDRSQNRYAGSRSLAAIFARKWMTDLVWIWHTRDSVTPRTSPISASVRPS